MTPYHPSPPLSLRSLNTTDGDDAKDDVIDSEVVPGHAGFFLESEMAATALHAKLGEWEKEDDDVDDDIMTFLLTLRF